MDARGGVDPQIAGDADRLAGSRDRRSRGTADPRISPRHSPSRDSRHSRRTARSPDRSSCGRPVLGDWPRRARPRDARDRGPPCGRTGLPSGSRGARRGRPVRHRKTDRLTELVVQQIHTPDSPVVPQRFRSGNPKSCPESRRAGPGEASCNRGAMAQRAARVAACVFVKLITDSQLVN